MAFGNPLRTGKLLVLRAARAAGLDTLAFHTPWRDRRLLILCYHGVSLDDEHRWDPSLYMAPDTLRRRMMLLRDSDCTVLPLGDALRRLYAGTLPPRAVALTVDDGRYDFYRMAFPIFQPFGFPVTVYYTTYYAAFNRPVYDPMGSYLLWKGRGRTLCWPEVLDTPGPLTLDGPGLRLAALRLRRYPAGRGLSGSQKDALLARLAELLEIDYPAILRRRLLHLMTLDEAREMAARGVDFQLHTHRHSVSLDPRLFAREISDNRAALRLLQSDARPVHFCYPGGVHRPEFLPWLAQAGIVSATTCEPGIASPRSPALLLPRLVDTTTLTEDEFIAWLSGIAAFLPQRRYQEAPGQFLEQRKGVTAPPARPFAG